MPTFFFVSLNSSSGIVKSKFKSMKIIRDEEVLKINFDGDKFSPMVFGNDIVRQSDLESNVYIVKRSDDGCFHVPSNTLKMHGEKPEVFRESISKISDIKLD